MTLKELNKKLKSVIEDTIDKELMTTIGKQVKKTVKTRTRKGYGVAENEGKKQKLKALKPATKRIRQNVKSRGKLSGKTTVDQSNLTRSGKMLDNIGFSASDSEVTVAPKGAEQIKAKDVSKERPFMNLSKIEIKEVAKTVEEAFINDIKKKGL